MGLFHKKLQNVVDTFRENVPPQGTSIAKGKPMEKRAYEKALAILDDHIKNELDEENSLGALAALLKQYKEKVEETKRILTKDFETDWKNITPEQYRKIGMNEPNFLRDFSKIQKNIVEAQVILKKIKALLKKMIIDEKIKLE